MKSILISIQPYWVFLIIAKIMGWKIGNEKTVEVRKNYPKAENWNKVAKIYCSKDKRSFSKIPKEYQPLMVRFLGKVIGEFVCNEIKRVHFTSLEKETICALATDNGDSEWYKGSCVSYRDTYRYLRAAKRAYAWHISDLVIYDKPKALDELFHACDKQKGTDCSVCIDRRENKCKAITRPPQSWCYVEV